MIRRKDIRITIICVDLDNNNEHNKTDGNDIKIIDNNDHRSLNP